MLFLFGNAGYFCLYCSCGLDYTTFMGRIDVHDQKLPDDMIMAKSDGRSGCYLVQRHMPIKKGVKVYRIVTAAE